MQIATIERQCASRFLSNHHWGNPAVQSSEQRRWGSFKRSQYRLRYLFIKYPTESRCATVLPACQVPKIEHSRIKVIRDVIPLTCKIEITLRVVTGQVRHILSSRRTETEPGTLHRSHDVRCNSTCEETFHHHVRIMDYAYRSTGCF